MNIEIHQPELETMIQQRMATGRFRDVEDVLLQALKSTDLASTRTTEKPALSLLEVFDRAREILDGEELVIERDPSPGRPVDFS